MDVTVVAVAAIVTGGLMLASAFSAWLRYHSGRKMRAHGADQLTQLTDEVRALRVALDAVAVEVERLGEEQRYATRLLRDRADATAGGAVAPPRVVTPH